MKPLLEIHSTPAKYEYEVSRARLEITQKKPTVDRTTTPASLNMRRQPGRLEMNSVRRRSDMGFKGFVDRANFEGDRGRNAAAEATGNYAEMGNALKDIQRGANIPDALWNMTMKYSKGDLVLMPVSPIEINYIPADLSIEFAPSQMTSNWDTGGRPQLDFVPGSFNLNFTQYSSIQIQYLGGPNYVPPSADPEFVADV